MRAIFAIGALISAIWLGAAASYVQFRITWQSLLDLPFVDLAAFVAAAFGPPAALWLIIGYVQLGSALRENNFALKQLHWQTKRAADQAEVEARTLVESRTSAKRAELFPLISYLIDELNPLVAHLAVELKLIDNAQYASAWQRFGQGDRWVFFRCILNTSGGTEPLERKIAATLKQDSKALPLAEEFRENFANLLKELRSVEGEGLITRLVERGNLGKLDLLLKRTMPQPEVAPVAPAPEPAFKPVGAPEPKPAPEPVTETAPQAETEPEEETELPPVPSGGWTAAVERPIPRAPAPAATPPNVTSERAPDPAPQPPRPVAEVTAESENQPEPEMPRDPQRDEARRALAEIAAALQAVDEANGRDSGEEQSAGPRPVPFPTRREPQLAPQRPAQTTANNSAQDTRPAPPTRPLLASQTLPREGSPFPTVTPAAPRDTDRKPAEETTTVTPPPGDNRPATSEEDRLPPIPEGIRPQEEPKRRLSPIVSGLFGNRPKDK